MYRAWEEAAKQDYNFYLWLNDDSYLFDGALFTLLDNSAKPFLIIISFSPLFVLSFLIAFTISVDCSGINKEHKLFLMYIL